MQQVHTIKRGDTSPAIVYDLAPANRTLAGATVRFKMALPGQAAMIDAPALILQELPPRVAYVWQPRDTVTAGKYDAEFTATYADGAVESSPNQNFLTVLISLNIPSSA
jgi:hypothetical protein